MAYYSAMATVSFHFPRWLVMTSGVAWSLCAVPTGWSDDLADYEWRSRVSGMVSGALHKVRLTAEIYDGMRAFPLDARLVDEEDVPWPSMIWSRLDRKAVEPVAISPVGRTERLAELGYTIKKFQVLPDRRTRETPRHNRVVITTGGGDFVRRVEVWGGPDENRLVLLGSGFLIERGAPAPVRQRGIDYPESTTPWLAIRLFHDPRQPDEAPEWRATEVVHVPRTAAEFDTIVMKRMSRPDDEPRREGLVDLYLDAGARHRPLHAMVLPFNRRDTAAPVRIFGRNDADRDWRWVADGGLHDVAGLQQNRIALNRADYRYWRVEIHGVDERSLRLGEITAQAIPHYLVFMAANNRPAFLYYGSPRYQLPRQDFVRGVSAETVAEAREASLSRRQVNPARMAGTLDAYGRGLLHFGTGVVVLLVALVTVRVIRHRFMN
ncbi:MAG TPA: DUF3999 family protein [Kiritimatiellia bacterium]|nr:DUF3999 family protein [Kiritimatiellia bacterium]